MKRLDKCIVCERPSDLIELRFGDAEPDAAICQDCVRQALGPGRWEGHYGESLAYGVAAETYGLHGFWDDSAPDDRGHYSERIGRVIHSIDDLGFHAVEILDTVLQAEEIFEGILASSVVEED